MPHAPAILLLRHLPSGRGPRPLALLSLVFLAVIVSPHLISAAEPEVPLAPPLRADYAKERATQRRTLAALDLKITITAREEKLSAVVSELSRKVETPIAIDRHALEAAGATLDAEVTLVETDVPLRTALRTLLRPLDLTYSFQEDRLVVTTPEDADSKQLTWMYDVRDLMGPTGGPRTPPAEEFMALVQNHVVPNSWDRVGGKGSISVFGKEPYVIVSQSLETHERLAEFFQELRAIRREQAAPIPK